MKILVSGASGVIGRNLLPLLIKEGHEVGGLAVGNESRKIIEDMKAQAMIANVFDRDEIFELFRTFKPDMVIHQITALKQGSSEENAKVREQGTQNIVDAAKDVGVKKIVAQSISWAYEAGDEPANETEALDIHAKYPRKTTIDGILSLERKVSEMDEYVILRNGTMYGQDTWYDKNGDIAEKVKRNELVATDAITSFVHVKDVANAIFLALNWPTTIVNIVDDTPVSAKTWLTAYAKMMRAPLPVLQNGRNQIERGASNQKAKTELNWQALYPNWEEGFKQMIS